MPWANARKNERECRRRTRRDRVNGDGASGAGGGCGRVEGEQAQPRRGSWGSLANRDGAGVGVRNQLAGARTSTFSAEPTRRSCIDNLTVIRCRFEANLQLGYSVSVFFQGIGSSCGAGQTAKGGWASGGHRGHRPLSVGRTCSNLLFKSST